MRSSAEKIAGRRQSLEPLEGRERRVAASIGEDLIVGFNPVLTSLDGLDGVAFVGADITIEHNDRLPTCEAEGFCERFRAIGWDGECIVEDNDDGGTCE